MPYDLPSALNALALLILALGLFAGLGLGLAVAGGALVERRWPALLVGVSVVVGGGYLALYAGSADTYYSPPITRWDYAARNSSRPFLVAALGCTVLAI